MPSKNCTLPSRVLGVTVAVKVTGLVGSDGLGDDASFTLEAVLPLGKRRRRAARVRVVAAVSGSYVVLARRQRGKRQRRCPYAIQRNGTAD